MATPAVLTDEQQQKLNEHKIKLRMDNERYLRSHPEIHRLIHEFTKKTLQQRPANIPEFAAEFFADADGLRAMIAAQDLAQS